jgi:spore germination cell wall hydrolase CwlJ-like protein
MKALITALFFFSLLPITSVANATLNKAIFVVSERRIEQPTVVLDSKQVSCVARAVYYEARGEDAYGKFAVAHVVINRVKQDKKSFCAIVNERNRHGCQFSWKCKKVKKIDIKDEAWIDSFSVATIAMSGYTSDNTYGATYFHSTKVNPKWNKVMVQTTMIGKHIFYKEPL